MTPRLLVAITTAAATLSAVVLTSAEAEDAAAGRAVYLGTDQELCESNGVMYFEDRDEWPMTMDGRRAIEIIQERCTKNPKAFTSRDQVAKR